MPRASGSAKRQQGANAHRETRHEMGSGNGNGFAASGKRILKQTSLGQLNGQAQQLTHQTADQSSVVPPRPNASMNGVAKLADKTLGPDGKDEFRTRQSAGAYGASASTESLASTVVSSMAEATHRQINVNDAKNTNVHRDSGPLELTLTVLRNCPLQDTLAILIILMQVSPSALVTIYMLFTLLTFVPPVTLPSSGLSVTDIFDGNQGTASLTTLICMDAIMLGIWLFLWAPMQQFILDLAQVVIALTLGGGGSSRKGTANNILITVLVVAVTQWTRHLGWGASFWRLASLVGSKPDADDRLETTLRVFEKKGDYGWIRSILAIHILTQGLVRYIREWYLRREKRDLLAQSQFDPEAGKPANLVCEATGEPACATAETDNEPAAPLHAWSSKKKRKQSAQVRIRQPLWAALASTKIVMVKEYELSHAASESAGTNATDIHNLGNAPFTSEPGQIWICYVGCEEVCFNTSAFPGPDETDSKRDEPQTRLDDSKPFYVKVNNAIWQPTRIMSVHTSEEDEVRGRRWTGDIYGLTPLSNYDCEFVSTRTGQVLFATSVRTLQATKDPETAAKASTPQPQPRHDSPATTLRASISAAELKLADEKARLKTARKDNNRKVAAARKEIERLTAAVQSAGSNDEKLRQKMAQNKIQERQAHHCVAEIDAELKELSDIPENLRKAQRTHQAAWTTEKALFEGARASNKSLKNSIDQEIKALEDEQTSALAKRNKIAARIAKVDKQHDRITDANSRGLDEAERRTQGRLAYEADMARNERQLLDRVRSLAAVNHGRHDQAVELTRQYDEMYNLLQKSHEHGRYQLNPWLAAPGQLGAQARWRPPSKPSPAPSLLPIPLITSFRLQPAIGTTAPSKAHSRSSSMLTDVSGFAEDANERGNANAAAYRASAAPGLGRKHTNPHGHMTTFAMQVQRARRVSPGFQSGLHRHGHQQAVVGDEVDWWSGSGSGPLSGRSSVGSGSLVGAVSIDRLVSLAWPSLILSLSSVWLAQELSGPDVLSFLSALLLAHIH